LRAKVVCRIAQPGDRIGMGTGIPPDVIILANMQRVEASVMALLPALGRVTDDVVTGVTRVLEDRAIGAEVVTRAGLQTMITDVLNASGLAEAVALMRRPAVVHGAPVAADIPGKFLL